ncbi:MAG: hypothetical protein R6U39_09700 [Candidatus Aegiribacteria sp.]
MRTLTIALFPVFSMLMVLSCSNPFASSLSISVTHPPAGGAVADESYVIQWVHEAPEYSNTGILLFVDTDLDPNSGLIQISDTLSVESSGYLWDCSLFPEDSYYVRAMIFEGSRQRSDYSRGTVTVSHSSPR